MHDTLQAPCEVPSKRERENPSRKPSARTTRLGDSKKVAFRTTVPRQRSSRLLKDNSEREREINGNTWRDTTSGMRRTDARDQT